MDDPKWLAKARTYVGMSEVPGPKHSPVITRWLAKLKAPFKDDETAWCGSFVGGVLEEVGLGHVKDPWGARNWLKFGKPIAGPAVGCIVVFWRGKPSGWSGHVGFVVGKDKKGNLMVLGGNQGNKVSIAPFATNRVLGYRWPSIAPKPERYNLPILDSSGQPLSTNEA